MTHFFYFAGLGLEKMMNVANGELLSTAAVLFVTPLN
jgi:hypothetical protein